MSSYGRAAVIHHAIESVLAQTYANWELAIVADCTPDDTAGAVAPYCAEDPRIRFHNFAVRVHDTGSATKNYGIREMSRGELVAYLDDDDRYRPQALETFVRHFRDHPSCVIAYGRVSYRDKDTGRRILGNPFRRWLHGYSREKLQRYNFIDINCVAHRRSLMDEVGWFRSDVFLNDWDMWRRVSALHDFDYIPKVLTERYVSEAPFLRRAVVKGWDILLHGRRT
jgi:glycosyltransferase involved in cell wall biosynthesis